MIPKILIFIGFICFVNASNLYMNIYAGADDKDVYALGDCDFRGCEQTCKRMGFPGGACVGDHCKCDITRPKGESVCDGPACTSSCERQNRLGGFCLGGKCICY